MRILLLLRGSAGCGKSTWIQNNGLKQYTLSADDIRLLCQSPIMKVDGTQAISISNDATVWKMLFQILEVRMRKGEFTVIDATNSKTSEMNQYKKLCDEYRYRMYCVDFTDIPIEETKRRNLSRPEYKRVPEEVIDNMYSRFKTQKIPSGIKVIRPDQLSEIWIKRYDLSEYKRIHHIGDIHGCYTVLQEYLTGCGGLKDDEFYIFLGDYIDRGIENVEILNFLRSVAAKKNVLLTAQQELELANIEAKTAKVQADKDKEVALIAAEKEKEKASIEAEQKRIQAEGEAKATKIKAEAEAEANKKIAGSLTKELIEKEKIEKWKGDVPKVQGSSTPIVSVEE